MRSFETIIAEIKAGRGPRLALLFGDALQTEQACRAIIDALVPEADRSFNLERLDGRSVAWDRIETALLTPPFLPGKKVVWVENAPYFYSREQRGELSEKILYLWTDGKRDEAVKWLIELLAVEGWTQERWDQLSPAASGVIAELFDVDDSSQRSDAEALVAYAKTKETDISARMRHEGNRMGAMLDRGVPEWDFFLLTALQVDRRMNLFKRLEGMNAVLFLSLERDRSGKVSRDGLINFIVERIKQEGKVLDGAGREMILARAGGDLRSLNQELEKLVLFVGERQSITAKDVETIVLDEGEGWIFDFTRAIGERNAVAALAQLARLLSQGDHPLKLLATVGSEMRRLMAARQLLDGEWRGLWRRNMSYQQFQEALRRQGTPSLVRNPYAEYMNFQRAEQFSMHELRSYMEAIFDTDRRLKSSGTQPRLVMEQLILRMCLGKRQKRPTDARHLGL